MRISRSYTIHVDIASCGLSWRNPQYGFCVRLDGYIGHLNKRTKDSNPHVETIGEVIASRHIIKFFLNAEYVLKVSYRSNTVFEKEGILLKMI